MEIQVVGKSKVNGREGRTKRDMDVFLLLDVYSNHERKGGE